MSPLLGVAADLSTISHLTYNGSRIPASNPKNADCEAGSEVYLNQGALGKENALWLLTWDLTLWELLLSEHA